MQFTELLWGLNGFPDIPCCQMPSTVIQTTVYKLSYYTVEKNREEGVSRSREAQNQTLVQNNFFGGKYFFVQYSIKCNLN